MNGSGSGSNHGSNGQNTSSFLTPPAAGTTKLYSDTAMPVNNTSGICKGNPGTSGSDKDRIAHREAALTKFRQKRKERCFDTKVTGRFIFLLPAGMPQPFCPFFHSWLVFLAAVKVRYQSRKKLAEQRPRVRGQFVRHNE